jgi:hypothetical protein
LYRGEPRVVCSVCGTPVYLVSTPDKAFFFRHTIEDGSCPAQTRGKWSQEQIRAMKYQGARESDAHRRIKALIARSLDADSRMSDVHAEKTWRSVKDPAAYRRPDVSAQFKEVRLAFEAQLSTTFLDVVVRRREFYRSEGAVLIWILPRFDPNDRRIMEDDILFMNNSNVLVVNEATTAASEAARRCFFLCFYREPYIDGVVQRECWRERRVALDELTLDAKDQTAYWFDFDAAEKTAETRCAEIARARQAAFELQLQLKQDGLREDVFAFWSRNGGWDDCDDDQDEQWTALRRRLAASGVEAPDHHKHAGGEFRTAVSALLSAKEGKPVGFAYNKLIEVAHCLAGSHRQLLLPFGWALNAYGTQAIVNEQDRTNKWKEKTHRIRVAIENDEPEYKTETTWSDVLQFLFPPIAEKISRAMPRPF